MTPLRLIFCVHNHQPEGNFDSVFESATRDAYLPFLKLLEDFPGVNVSLHFSGILLRWLSEHQPDTLELLHGLVDRGQVELLGGGFHEPVLSAIPDRDKLGQIEKLSRYLKRRFGIQPRGMWLAERIWEQHLVKSIAATGMEFTALDDTHFLYAGLREEDLFSWYITEEEGRQLSLFPINRKLRYLIPFADVEDTIEHLLSLHREQPGRILVYGDDGEKFGIWPRTFRLVWEKGWMERFFTALVENSTWLRTTHFSEILDTTRAKGTIYIPNASYAEMMHWSLPDPKTWKEFLLFEEDLERRGEMDRNRRFVKGGFWRNFMVKYPEVNQMHKRMLRVSRRVQEASGRGNEWNNPGHQPMYRSFSPANVSGRSGSARRPLFAHAQDSLWAAQCNCAYWHGVFGGLYLPHIRHEVYRNLIDAEIALDELEGKGNITVDIHDFDADGANEIIVESPRQNMYFDPQDGAKLIELDYKPARFNLIDTLTRREEGYHATVASATFGEIPDGESSQLPTAKEEGLERYLIYDWYRKACFVDHIFGADTTVESFASASYQEEGDFTNQPYSAATAGRNGEYVLTFSRDGGRWKDGVRHPLRLIKVMTLRKGSDDILIRYTLENLGEHPLDLWFGIEMNYNLLAGDAPERYYSFDDVDLGNNNKLGSVGEITQAKRYRLTDEWNGIEIEMSFNDAAMVWRCPVESVSMSENGFERTHQGCTVVSSWKCRLEKEWRLSAKHTVRSIRRP